MGEVIEFGQRVYPLTQQARQRKHMTIRNGQSLSLGRGFTGRIVTSQGRYVLVEVRGNNVSSTIGMIPLYGDVLTLDEWCGLRLQVRCIHRIGPCQYEIILTVLSVNGSRGPGKLRDVRVIEESDSLEVNHAHV